jgi:DNA-binding transcriptional LysR family regulator
VATQPRHSLDQLLVLDTIVQTGSFAAAARVLHRVPSAISYTVQALEDALGVSLFDRSGHRAVLTPAGARLLEEGRELLRRARQLDQLAATLGEGWEPELRVVVDGALPLEPVTDALKIFVERRIPTRVHLDVEYQDGVLERFDGDHADLMLALGIEDGGRLKGTPLPPLEMLLVVGSSHPLASRGRIHREQLLDHVDLVVKDTAPAFAKNPRKSFLGSRHIIRFSDFHSKQAALRSGLGYGWLPAHLAEPDLQSGRLVLLDFPEGNRWTYHPQLVTRREEHPGRAATLLIDLLLGSTSKNLNKTV